MNRTAEERDRTERFGQTYRRGRTTVMLDIERAVCGCDYGGNSFATRSEADDVATLLALRPGVRLLDVGAGSGWPGLYMADRSGCDAVLVDLPYDGLHIARARAAQDGFAERSWFATADGAHLPFTAASFDAISHSDVLCCLAPKQAMLASCRRVIRPAGKMVFSVIAIAAGLSPADHRHAKETGPPHVETETDYPEMLEATGWRLAEHIDLTPGYLATLERFLDADTTHADALADVIGEVEYADRLKADRDLIAAIGDGLYRRDLFFAVPVS